MTTEEKIYMVLAALERIDRRFVFLPIEEIKQRLTNEWLDFWVWFFVSETAEQTKSNIL